MIVSWFESKLSTTLLWLDSRLFIRALAELSFLVKASKCCFESFAWSSFKRASASSFSRELIVSWFNSLSSAVWAWLSSKSFNLAFAALSSLCNWAYRSEDSSLFTLESNSRASEIASSFSFKAFVKSSSRALISSNLFCSTASNWINKFLFSSLSWINLSLSIFSSPSSLATASPSSFSNSWIVLIFSSSTVSSWALKLAFSAFASSSSSSMAITAVTLESSEFSSLFCKLSISFCDSFKFSFNCATIFLASKDAPFPSSRMIMISASKSEIFASRSFFSVADFWMVFIWVDIASASSDFKLSTSRVWISASSRLSFKILIVPSASCSWDTACLVSTDSPNPAVFIRAISSLALSSSDFKSRTKSCVSSVWLTRLSCSKSNLLCVSTSCCSRLAICNAASLWILSFSSRSKTSSTFALFNSSRKERTTWSVLILFLFCASLVSSNTWFKSCSWPAITFTTWSSSFSCCFSSKTKFSSSSFPFSSSSLRDNCSRALFWLKRALSSSTLKPSITSVALACSLSKRMDSSWIRVSESARFCSISFTKGIAGNFPSEASLKASWATWASSSSDWIVLAKSNSLLAICFWVSSSFFWVSVSANLDEVSWSSNPCTLSAREFLSTLFSSLAFNTSFLAALRSSNNLLT